MKLHATLLGLIALTCFGLTGCVPTAWDKERSNTFVTEYGSVEFAFPPGWKKQTEENPFDLQCLSRNEEMNCGIFIYTPNDLNPETTPQSVLTRHIDDIRSKREDFKELSAPKTVDREDKVITLIPCTGQRNGELFSYIFVRVDFKNDPTLLAILLHVALPELQDRAEENALRIAGTAKSMTSPTPKP